MKRKQVMAMFLATAMVVTSLPANTSYVYAKEVSVAQDAAQEINAETKQNRDLVLHYDFDSLKSGTIVNDVSGHGSAGVVRPTGSQAVSEAANIYGTQYTAVVMNGGTPDGTHTYVELPQGIFNDMTATTISCYVYVKEHQGYQRIWDFGSDTTSYFYLLTDGYNSGHQGYTAALTKAGWSKEMGPEGDTLETGKWIFTTVTFDGETKTMSLYQDGVLVGTEQTDADLSVLKDSKQNWIGYGQFQNDILNGKVADFKIYNYAMTADEVAAEFDIPDEQRVKMDKEALSLGDTSAVTKDIELPAKGSAGSVIAWTSSNEGVISKKGKVTRPTAGAGDATVTLTATISSGKETDTKDFTVVVKQELTDAQRVSEDLEAVDLGELNAVMSDIELPKEGSLGSKFSWKSSNTKVIGTDGTVNRPVGTNTDVTLTLTATSGKETKTRTFKVTVVATYSKLKVANVEKVAVTTAVGTLPSLPNTVKVTMEDQSERTMKAVWPTDLKVSEFAETGTKTVEGHLVGYVDVKVAANVKIEKETTVPKEAVATQFSLSDVTLNGTNTIYGENMERDLTYLKTMDADRMLYNFRKTFKQDTKGAKALTGWEEPTGLLRGHSTGHFLSALSLAYASTGDSAYKEKLDYMIKELRQMQLLSKGNAEDFKTGCTPTSAAQSKWSTDPSEWGEGFISAYSPDQFALLEQYTPYATIWAPYYTLHKLMAGFIDSYIYGGNEEALEIAKDLGTWVYRRLSNCTTKEQCSKMWSMYIAGEFGGMNESLSKLYEITGEKRYLEAAEMFDNTTFFNNLANNVDDIANRHANQHIPQIIGAIHEYGASGEASYYNVAKNFWDMVTGRYAYSIGGVGTGETFKTPYEQANYILGNAGRGENCETCAAYNMLKLTKDLYCYNPDDATYMDYYERTIMNQIAASQSHDTTEYMHNGVTYMLPIDPGQRKDYDSDYGGFTCCNGTGMENHVKYQEAAYAKTSDTLYVNLYMPTTVNWKERNVTVVQETNFPSEHATLTVKGSGSFKVKLRVPYWATKGFTVKVNGETICTKPEVSTYVELNRTWKTGDVITIDMPYTIHLDEAPDKVDGDTVASLMYGPIVMVAKDTRSEYTPMNWYKIALSENLEETVQVVTGADDADGKVPHLVTNNLDFYPMYDAYNYRYHAYVKVEEQKENSATIDWKAVTAFKQYTPVMNTATVKDTKVIVSWKAVANAQSYTLYKKEAGSNSYTKLTTQSGTTYTDAAVKTGKTYSYYVMATWNTGIYTVQTKASKEVKVEVKAVAPPVVVQKVTAPKVSIQCETSKKVALSWKKVSAAISYEVYRKENVKKAKYKKIAVVKASKLYYKDRTVTIGKEYCYYVKAVNKVSAKASEEVKCTVRMAAPKVTAKSNDKRRNKVYWSMNGTDQKVASAYVVYRRTTNGSWQKLTTVSKKQFSYNDRSAKSGKTYYYTVRAYKTSGKAKLWSAYDKKGVKVKTK